MDNPVEVPFFSLETQNALLKDEVLQAIGEIIDQADFVLGTSLGKFEKSFASYCSSNHCVGVSNGTAALYLALKALKITTGDEVIVPGATFSATAQAVSQLGAIPVFAEIDKDTWTIDAEDVQRKIGKRTKAIIVVHLYGNPCDLDEIKRVTKGLDIAIIEDAAQAHGALYKGEPVGGLSDVGCFSFYPSKNLGAMGDAGAVVFNGELLEAIRALRNCGKNNQGEHTFMGFNYRMSTMQAAVLNIKLPHLPLWNKKRQAIAEYYKSQTTNEKITFQEIKENCESVYHLIVVKPDSREKFVAHLKNHHIGYSFHYATPVHLLPIYASLDLKKGALPVTEDLFDRCVSLPVFPDMTTQQMNRVVEVLNAY
tara:strand:+ start:771 stop:1874 length:1104 start_codon:yes stop_codon:yes gene_type:complete